MLVIAWGCFAIYEGFSSAQNNPSTGTAAGCAVIMGLFALIIGGLLTWWLLP
jgi:hypothetical protein